MKGFFTCAICYQLNKNPKYLPCHHSYCEGCLEKIQVKSKIICPNCRTESALPVGGVKDLPTNYIVSHQITKSSLKHKEDDEVLKCNECIENEPVVAHCQTCSSFLCQFCCENHKRSKQFHDHKTVAMAKLNSNKHVSIQPKAVSLTCKEHDIELSFYCETCEQLVCEHCVVKNHCGHSYTDAKIQTCKCQIELNAISLVKMMREDLSKAYGTIDEVTKGNKEVGLPTKENAAGTAVVIHVDGPYQISCDGESGGYFMWKNCGLAINFAPKCSQQHIKLTTNTFLPIENEVYPGVHIVSAVYQFDCNIERFNKPFILRLQHCVKLQSPEDCQKMRFMVLQDGSNYVKYGSFEVGKCYGIVRLNRFCHIFIIWIDEPWKNIRIIFLPVSSDGDSSSQQVPSNQSSDSGMQALSTSQANQRESYQLPDGQQHVPSESVPSSSSACNSNFPTSPPPFMYGAMIGLPKNHCNLREWSSIYSIHVNLEAWRNVCKESIQMEEVINNFTINFYAGEIEFDAGGVAKITCEKTPEANIVVDCCPNQITKEGVIKSREDYINKCEQYPLCDRRKNIIRTMVQKSHIHVTKMSDALSSNCQLAIKGIEPQQQVDLCTDHYTNFTLIGTVDSQSTPHSNTGLVQVTSGLMANDIHIDVSPCLKQSGVLDKKPKIKDLIITGLTRQLAAKWETVAYILDYDTPKINNIKKSKREDPESCCQELLRDWVEEKHDDAPKTWFTLLNTIAEDETFTRAIDNVLKKLEKKYLAK